MKQKIFTTVFSAGRKTALVVLLSIAFAASSFASGPDGVDQKVTSHFSNAFKNVSNVNWSVTDLYTQASFEWMDQKINAFYDNDGSYFGMSREISVESLPAKALKTIQEKYAGSVATQAIEFNDAQKSTNYYVLLENAKSSIILQVSNSGEISVLKKTNRA